MVAYIFSFLKKQQHLASCIMKQRKQRVFEEVGLLFGVSGV